MKTDNIKKLLEAFYEGQTTPEQDKDIYSYFVQDDIDLDLEKERNVFLNLHSISEHNEMPTEAKLRLERFIDELAEKEEQHNAKKILPWKWIGGIAASVLIIASTALYLQTSTPDHKLLVDTYNNPQDAYIETQKAMSLVSSKLNKGFEQYGKAEDNILKINTIISQKIDRE